jgi:hypothetical protein
MALTVTRWPDHHSFNTRPVLPVEQRAGFVNRRLDTARTVPPIWRAHVGRAFDADKQKRPTAMTVESIRAPRNPLPRIIMPRDPIARQIEVLKALILDPPENSRVIPFTPGLASHVLQECNSGNRKMKPRMIRRYKADMEQGGWRLTGETIIFSRGGILLDGQNRMAACLQAGKLFRTHTVFGIADDTFPALNSGASRNSSDLFYKAAVPHAQIVGNAVRWIMIYESGDPTSRASYGNPEMFDFYNEHVDQDVLTQAVEWTAKVKGVPSGALAAHLYLFLKKDGRVARRFADDLTCGKRVGLKLPARLSKARVQNMGRLHDTWINALIVLAWNAYRAGETVTEANLMWNDARQEYPAIA